MRFAYITFSLILTMMAFTGCQKEYSYQRKGSASAFSIVASGCSGSTVKTKGTYLEGIPLTTAETISAEVDVTATGKWEYHSDTVNGFSFSGSGEFEDIGLQTITLIGKGTPLSAGNYIFPLEGKSGIYQLTIYVLKPAPVTETVPAELYFKGTIDGIEYYVSNVVQGPDLLTHAGGGPNADTAFLASFIAPSEYPPSPGKGGLSLQKDYMPHYQSSSESDFKKFFMPGSYPYRYSRIDCPTVLSLGIIMFWVDSEGKDWETFRDPQEGSSFQIVGIEDGHNQEGEYYVKVKSKFNCKLYHRPTGEIKLLTNGESVSIFIRNR